MRLRLSFFWYCTTYQITTSHSVGTTIGGDMALLAVQCSRVPFPAERSLLRLDYGGVATSSAILPAHGRDAIDKTQLGYGGIFSIQLARGMRQYCKSFQSEVAMSMWRYNPVKRITPIIT
jgi:hypothetical protein